MALCDVKTELIQYCDIQLLQLTTSTDIEGFVPPSPGHTPSTKITWPPLIKFTLTLSNVIPKTNFLTMRLGHHNTIGSPAGD